MPGIPNPVGRRRFLTGAAATGGLLVAAGTGSNPAAADPSGSGSPATPGAPGPATVVTPADQQYPDLITGNNTRWTSRPASVHLVNNTDQVIGVVREAVRTGVRLTVRGGGHCYEDFVHDPTVTMILDTARMNRVYFDPARRAVAVEAGATLLDVYERMYEEWGVTIPAGICHAVGVGGHIAGGGWGLLCRKHGLSIDHLYAVEVVVVDAEGAVRAVVATREPDDPHRDLWWAHTGGGGGNFGVITRYWFRSPGATGSNPGQVLPRPPQHVLIKAVSLPWDSISADEFSALAHNYANWHVAHRDPGGPYGGLCSYLELNHRSQGSIGLTTQLDATVPDAERLLEDYVAAVTAGVRTEQRPLSSTMGERNPMPQFFAARRIPWLQAMRFMGLTNGLLNDPTLRGEFKSAYMRAGFRQSHVDRIYRNLTSDTIDNPTVQVTLSSFGGQVNAVAPGDTAFPHRDSAFKMYWQILWSDPAEDERNVSWLRSFYGEIYAETGGVPVPDDVTDGCYLNYADADLSDPEVNRSDVPWHGLYYKENYPRLQRVKAAWDPRDMFHHRQSVRLPD
ncbi:MAG: FAD-binding protein [Actinophytocola sp.]|uniref:FAD-binding oxidoreductase n=1 Tax=Actinophytocola sp. TaxID=1872138 RepID=UPI003C770A1E